MTIRGKLVRRDIGPGVWVLETARGSYSLRGAVPAALEGLQVEVEAEEEDSFGFSMIGPTLRLGTIRAA
ncbi:MAG TPA: hypothetical protein PKY30_23880 [Myxococcota bacterium]|nr:hypothetical protein [Myxococcota bacterium]HNH50099.1 hypothetical protein [Myxococcota bacterium]